MRQLALASVLLGLAACGEPAIEVHLTPPGMPTVPFTYDCIGAVDVFPIPVGYVGPYDIAQTDSEIYCIDLDHPPTSVADLLGQLRGQLDMDIPAGGIQAMEVRARAGTCEDPSLDQVAILYGGGVYTGGDNLTINLSHNISCGDSASYAFRPVDLSKMATTHACDPVTSGTLYVADIRPTNFGPASIREYGSQYAILGSDATQATLQTYSASMRGTCLAAGVSDAAVDSTTCISNLFPSHLCDPNAFDVPFFPTSYLDNSEAQASSYETGDYQGQPVLVAVYQNQGGQMMPVAGASVATANNAQASFVFGDLDMGMQTLMPTAAEQVAQKTTTSGLFMAYLNGLTELDVTAPGPAGTTLHGSAVVGPDSQYTMPALIVLK